MKMPKINTHLDQQKLWQHKANRWVSILIKPLRIFQFFAVMVLFAITIYIIIMSSVLISAIALIFLIVMSGIYVFVLAVELISHFVGGALHIIPMTIFSLLGLLFFGITGIWLLFITLSSERYDRIHVEQTLEMTLCLLAALLFLIDITMVLAFWKRKCSTCQRCDCSTAELFLLQQEDEKAKMMRHDVTTSLSDVRVPRELEGIATPDHCYRKIEYPQRREYVDCPTCVPSLCNLSVAQIQTEPKRVTVVESQTPRATTKETPMQTVSKCEFCYQQLLLPAVGEKAGVPGTRCFQQTSQWSYPAIVQFVRGGVNAPCCSGCKCTTETAQQQQPQQLTQQRAVTLTPNSKSNLSNTPIKKTILEHESVKSEASMERSDEENATGDNGEIERSKGGGEHCRNYQEFMRARERGSLTNLMESPMHTCRTLVAPLSGRTKPRSFLQLKSNKVDPIKDANVFDEDRSPEGITPRMALDDQTAQGDKHPTGSSKPTIEHQVDDACSMYKRQKSLTPTSDNAGSHVVFKDKKGKYFCELCAPLDSKKITSRFDGTDLRKLRCTNCRLHLRDRGVRTNVKPKSDASSKYGRSQRHAASPSST